MFEPRDSKVGIYTLSKLLTANEIRLSAWSQNGRREILALFMGNGDFLYYYLTDEDPVVKQIPWFTDPVHTPVSIAFNPSGTFLLVLSQSCHLYVIPALSLLDANVMTDHTFDVTDITIYIYPFNAKQQKPLKSKLKSPNSSLNVKSSLSRQSSSSSISSNESQKQKSCSSTSTNDSKTNENIGKLKEMLGIKCEVVPSVVTWWQCVQDCQHVAVIGTKSGDIVFVDLSTGVKIGETTVKGQVKSLSICQDNSLDTIFLLITVDNNEQYKLVLEQRHTSYIWPGKQANITEDGENIEGMNLVGGGKGNYLPSARARLQGLKQLSVEKLATLKQKIAETRSKVKQVGGISDDPGQRIYGSPAPENLGATVGDTYMSPQFSRERHVLAGYYSPSQLLTVHSMALDVVPLFIHKMPPETDEVLLCDRIMYVVSRSRSVVQVVSCHLSEARLEPSSELNTEAILGTWELKRMSDGEIDASGESRRTSKPDLIPDNLPDENGEKILSLYKSHGRMEPLDLASEYKIEKTKDELPDAPNVENCVVVTNKNVFILELKSNIVKIALQLILETQQVEKAERICNIFGVNLQKLLELAGDIKLASLEFPKAIALYKFSKCGLLKSIVKLSCGGHCSQVLSYSTMLMSSAAADMTLPERIHLSNLVLMAYTQQILKRDNSRPLMEKFLGFLEKNNHYDEMLAVSVTGQSLLFPCLHKLIRSKGLILEGLNVLVKLMQRFLKNKFLEWALDKPEFWTCVTEESLIEAIVIKSSSLGVYVEYVTQHLESLELQYLDRLLVLSDPTSVFLRPVARVARNETEPQTFPMHKLVELFLVTLLTKLSKARNEEYHRELLLPVQNPQKLGFHASSVQSGVDSLGSRDNLAEQIWPIRKDMKVAERPRRRCEKILSCGYGHTALIRNGSVYTWGQTGRGCLGHGPTMSRHASPLPITWLGCLKIEVSIVSCGRYHSAALTSNGLYTWGCSTYGQLGLDDLRESPHPRLVSTLADESITTVVCGQYHTLALTQQGQVYAWGWGVHGQLGLGRVEDQRVPTRIEALAEHLIVDVAAGHGHSIVLSDKGHVYSFGSSVFGQLGTGTSTKSTLPVLVKGINGKVSQIATGYFHNLALTDSNQIYTWGTSPQSLRLQAQAHKRSRLLQSQNNGLNSPTGPPEPEPARSEDAEHNETEAHVQPSVVDTRHVTEKILQISCGCHHSALVTESGLLYTWGRSLDGQLGNGGQREVVLPTPLPSGLKVDVVCCGSDFTVAQERHTGKVFSWGSNSLGQLGLPVKDSSNKSLDGKLIMLKSCKRVVRIPHTGANPFDTPREVPDIPSASFTYQTLSEEVGMNASALGSLDNEGLSQRSLHCVIERFAHVFNMDAVLNKCVLLGNYQAASKIELLRNNMKQSLIYQLKALHNVRKYHFNANGEGTNGTKTPISEIPTPDSEIHLFTLQGGHEQMCDESHSEGVSSSDDNPTEGNGSKPDDSKDDLDLEIENDLNYLKTEYIELAKHIVETYLDLDQSAPEPSQTTILETSIQFWTAEKLPMTSLESFFLDKIDRLFYDLGCLFFCQQTKENQAPLVQQFSSGFLLTISSKILTHIERNESCVEYLETMSKILVSDKPEVKTTADGKRRRHKNRKPKSENYVEVISERLKKQPTADMINVSMRDVRGDPAYLFSCGHCHTVNSLREECKIFKDLEDSLITTRLNKLYEKLEDYGRADLACPQCVNNCLKQ